MKYSQDTINCKIAYITKSKWKYFFNKPNVVGVALGYKIIKGFNTKIKSIKVFVSKKMPKYILNKDELIPKFYNGIITDVVESGTFKFLSLTQRIRPVEGGYSIGPSIYDSAGSMGCLVTDNKYIYILSCNHVLAIGNTVPLNTTIIQQGVADGGNPNQDVVAILSKYIPLKFRRFLYSPVNYVDCAIAKVISPSLVTANISFVGKPQGTIIPILNKRVKKVGSTTELTTGIITDIDATLNFRYRDKDLLFQEQILTLCTADDGDSGSLLLDNNNYAVGLVMGASRIYCVCNPINPVLKSLGVRLITS